MCFVCVRMAFSVAVSADWEWRWPGDYDDAAIRFSVIEAPGCPLALALDYVVRDPLTGTANPKRLVKTTSTLCHYGGRRLWFRCPIAMDDIACNRRVGMLFLPPDPSVFGCRHCHNLTYRSSQTHDPRISKLFSNPVAY